MITIHGKQAYETVLKVLNTKHTSTMLDLISVEGTPVDYLCHVAC